MAGITQNGFVKKTLAEIKSELEAVYRVAFGNAINLQAPSLAATQIGIHAEREAKIWDLAEEGWNSRSPSTAQGVSLDNIGDLTNTEKLEATKSLVLSQLLFGDVGTLIDTSVILSVEGNAEAKFMLDSPVVLEAGTDAVQKLAFSAVPDAGTWTATLKGLTTSALAFDANAAAVQAALRLLSGFEDVTVSGDYTAGFTVTFTELSGKQPQETISASSSLTLVGVAVTITPSDLTAGVAQGVAKLVATGFGPIVAPSGTLTVIDTPVTGFSRTVNTTDAELGRLVETDAEYRIRRKDELERPGAATVEAIRTKVKLVEAVQEVIVFQNTTHEVDGDGRPPKSVTIYVDGGVDADIAKAIWLAVAGGIETYGTASVGVIDSQGLTQTIKFNRPVEKNVYVTFDVTIDPDTFPALGSDAIKAAAVAYGDTLKIGGDLLVYPKLLPAVVDNVAGILDIDIKVGFAPAPTLDDNLVAAASERLKFDTARVVVNII